MTHNAVIKGMTPGVRTMKPARGTLNWVMVTPRKYKMLAARTWPATLAGADISRTSVDEPDGEKWPRAASTTPQHLRRVGEDRAQGRHCGGNEHGREEPEEHGRPAAIGDGLLVHGPFRWAGPRNPSAAKGGGMAP